MNLTRKIVRFCAEEVCRQGRGPIQVSWMVDAWMAAADMWPDCMQNDDALLQAVILLGSHVEERNPLENFRGVGVRVGDHICPSPAEVPSVLSCAAFAQSCERSVNPSIFRCPLPS